MLSLAFSTTTESLAAGRAEIEFVFRSVETPGRRRCAQRKGGAVATASKNGNVEDIYPLAPMQRGMLFQDLLTQEGERPYIQQIIWRADATIDLAFMRRSWEHVVEAHPVLRSFVVWEDRVEPIQVVCSRVELPWCDLDWSGIPAHACGSALDAHLAADRCEGFVLSRAPLMRLTAIRLPDGSVQMVWTFHHLVLDGWSLSPLFTAVLTGYRAARHGGEPPAIAAPPYRRFIEWLAARDAGSDRAYWRALLRDFSGATPVRGGAGRPTCIERRTTVSLLSRDAGAALAAMCARHRLTLSVAVQVAWAIVLGADSRTDDVVFGLTLAGRPPDLADAHRIVGLFINTVPVRLRLDPGLPIADLLRLAMDQAIAREDHQYAGLSQIKAWAGIAGNEALFDSIVVVENYPIERQMRDMADSLGMSGLRAVDGTDLALTLIVTPGDRLELKLLHDGARVSNVEAEGLLKLLGHVLATIAADSGQRLGQMPMLDAAQAADVLRLGQGPERAWGRPNLLHRLVEEQVRRSPDAIAVLRAGRSLTFAELDGRANQLSHRLRGHGVGPDRIVGIAMQRSLEMIVGLLAVLKAGGAFVMIDPHAPAERLGFLVADTDLAALVVHSQTTDRFPPHGAPTICLDGDWTAIADEDLAPTQHGGVGPDHLAYLIYTSGSTGMPKGAMNTHGAICNRLLWMQDEYRLDASDRVLHKTPCSFDVSVWELFWPLLSGARLVIAEPGSHNDPARVAQLISDEQITTAHFVPSMLQLFLEEKGLRESCASMRRTICSGEALSCAVMNRFLETVPGELHNLYGPAEAAIDVTCWPCRRDSTAVPIGRPIANVALYVLDAHDRLVPRGMAGELHIGGAAPGRGYHGRAELTAECFVTVPGLPERALYRTGDLVRWGEDDTLEFLGRIDDQIKLRGMRIEPGEVECALRSAPGVNDAVVMLERGGAGGDRLVGYVTAREDASLDSTALIQHLHARLPASMVPSRLDVLDRLPLSPNGKLDRKALSRMTMPRLDTRPAAPPMSVLERSIADTWCDVLRIDRVGARENFFEIGGTSLAIVPVHRRLRDAWDPTLRLAELLQYPTVEALARRLSPPDIRAEDAPASALPPAAAAEGLARRLDLRWRRQAARGVPVG